MNHWTAYDNKIGDCVRIYCGTQTRVREMQNRLHDTGIDKTYLGMVTLAYAQWRAELIASVRRSTPSFR